MTVCNMSIEMGARGGLIAPDETTIAYVKGRAFAPKGDDWDKTVAYWRTLYSFAPDYMNEVIRQVEQGAVA